MSGWHVASVQAPTINSDPVNGHRYQGWRPCMEWCKEQFGINYWRFQGEGVFEFKTERDRTLFLLKWA